MRKSWEEYLIKMLEDLEFLQERIMLAAQENDNDVTALLRAAEALAQIQQIRNSMP